MIKHASNSSLTLQNHDLNDPFESNANVDLSHSDTPYRSAVLARDEVRMGLEESGGDSSQDGCAFHVKDLDALFAEFTANGLVKERSEFDIETHGDVPWKVFYVVAPDGLCYWFGERQAG